MYRKSTSETIWTDLKVKSKFVCDYLKEVDSVT